MGPARTCGRRKACSRRARCLRRLANSLCSSDGGGGQHDYCNFHAAEGGVNASVPPAATAKLFYNACKSLDFSTREGERKIRLKLPLHFASSPPQERADRKENA